MVLYHRFAWCWSISWYISICRCRLRKWYKNRSISPSSLNSLALYHTVDSTESLVVWASLPCNFLVKGMKFYGVALWHYRGLQHFTKTFTYAPYHSKVPNYMCSLIVHDMHARHPRQKRLMDFLWNEVFCGDLSEGDIPQGDIRELTYVAFEAFF